MKSRRTNFGSTQISGAECKESNLFADIYTPSEERGI